jgi:uncharacterized membrane protein
MGRLADGWARQRALLQTTTGRWMAGALAIVGVATAIALAASWPDGSRAAAGQVIVASDAVRSATVTSLVRMTCPVETRPGCARVGIELDSGPRKGHASYLDLPGDEAAPRLSPGDHIRVTPTQPPIGGVSGELLSAQPGEAPYAFVDYSRGHALLALVVLFAVMVVVLGRRVGAVSLVGAAAGLLLVTRYVAPAILDGEGPVLVALIGTFAAMFLSIIPLYGIGAKSLAALVGTAISLVAIGALAVLGVHAAHITGTASEDATLVQSLGGSRLSLQGLVIAGILIGALGVLNDVTVSQASTVLALRRANPAQSARSLYRHAMEVGRDHLGATVNTLVFAYAGAALPLLLIFSSQNVTFGDAVNRETVASEIVAAICGSIGLIAAVPLTTMAATALAVRLPAEALPDEHDGHAH